MVATQHGQAGEAARSHVEAVKALEQGAALAPLLLMEEGLVPEQHPNQRTVTILDAHVPPPMLVSVDCKGSAAYVGECYNVYP